MAVTFRKERDPFTTELPTGCEVICTASTTVRGTELLVAVLMGLAMDTLKTPESENCALERVSTEFVPPVIGVPPLSHW